MAKDYPSKAKEKSEENPTTPRQNLDVTELEKQRAERRKSYKERVTKPQNKERGKKVAILAAQMKRRGLNVDSIKSPEVINRVGRMVLGKDGKLNVTLSPRTKGEKFKSLVKKILNAAHSTVTGEYLRVGKKQVTGAAKQAYVPPKSKIESEKTATDFRKARERKEKESK